MIAKMILPWFGGTAAVWTTCLLFFQVVLLFGYLYAYWSVRHLRPNMQAAVHIVLLVISLAMLPMTPSLSWKPQGTEDPLFRILALLAVSLGLPYFLLSTTSPLGQAWFARTHQGSLPYRLFALSNFASMLALLSYPILVEPFLTTRRQSLSWSIAYGVFVLFSVYVSIGSRRANSPSPEDALAEENLPKPTVGMHVLWTALPACASVLLLAVTNHLSQNVAAIPFLWVLPLSLYLLSFILCFERQAWYSRRWFLPLLAIGLAAMCYTLADDNKNTSVWRLIPLFSASLFVACMVCHGELVKLKPNPRYLTSFYVMCSLGGAVGGVFVALVAPRFFSGYFELPIGMVACAVLGMVVLFRDRKGRFGRLILAVVGMATLALAGSLWHEVREIILGSRVMVRNFYGVLRVEESGEEEEAKRTLLHGTINHGTQYLSPTRRRWPTTYYGEKSGVGMAIENCGHERGQRVGVIGLGAGTLSSYARVRDYYTFYEINPLVLRLANSEFSYLKDSRDAGARVDVVMGDARLSLENRAPQHFDVLAVDAFSSDSIPIHLLTKEAFATYFRHLKESGVLAVHASNRYLDLRPVVASAAAYYGKEAVVVDTDDEDNLGVFGATWILVTTNHAFLENSALKEIGKKPELKPGFRLWTDDFSDLYRILKKRSGDD